MRYHLRHNCIWLLAFALLYVEVQAQDCPMTIWVFDSIDRCDDFNPPNADGEIYADGECHTVATTTTTDRNAYALFPGTYRAMCTALGNITIVESGCKETCAMGDNVCERDFSRASLYSRLDPPEYVVQNPADATINHFFRCLRVGGSSEDSASVTFAIFGDCSAPGCMIEGAPTTSTPTMEPIALTPAPASAAPTNRVIITQPPTTQSPTPAPTDVATEKPVTLTPTNAPVPAPTTVPPTKAPSAVPTSTPTVEPSLQPTFSPIQAGDPTRSPVIPTNTPTLRPVTIAPSPQPVNETVEPTITIEDGVTKVERFPATMRLTPIASELLPAALSLWEEATVQQIEQVESVDRIVLSEIFQQLVAGADGEQSLDITFNGDIAIDEESTDTAEEVFAKAFGSELDRSKYLLKLAPQDENFESVELVEVFVNGRPANANQAIVEIAEPSSRNTGVIAGSIAGILLLIMAATVAGCFIFRSKHRKSGKEAASTSRQDSPSSINEVTKAETLQQFTNEIVVDPSADDVSTLGGSVLAGLNLVEGNNNNNTEDEPTASVNLDYDYGKSQYNDERSRSMTEASGPTAFTSFSKLGLLGDSVFADDMSFEQQYAPDELETNHERVRPFDIRAPPGMLGMVLDTPDGGVPVVRAIKPDSVLQGRVQIGDRLIAVDNADVTRMTALEVSSLISVKSNQHRFLVFVRLPQKNS